jgi:peptidoglycan/LPS O-acetylase OafA/YrhL
VRPDIQILRGVAVLAVMLAHFGSLLPGGFLGVDIFFAISGFVITQSFMRLLSEEKRRGAILKKFWLRRFWRLFPALSLVLTVTLVSAFLMLPAADFRDQLEMTVWSFFFAGNVGVEVTSQQDYFDPAANFNWLLHLWSLGVEEQFYIVFPFIMIALLSNPKRLVSRFVVIGAVIVGSAVSFLLAGLNDLEVALIGENRLTSVTGISAALGYYSPLARAWQFGFGIVAALLSANDSALRRTPLRPLLGLSVLLMSFLFMPESNLLPGPLTLVPMAATFVLLRFPLFTGTANSLVPKSLTWLGNRSYSAYLWHWPVWSVLSVLLGEGIHVIFSAFLLTLTLSEVTYRYVERPLIQNYRSHELKREKMGQLARNRFSMIAFLVAPLSLGGFVVGAEYVLGNSGLIGQRATVTKIDPSLDCLQTPCGRETVDVLLVGDSHAGALANSLASALGERGITMRGAILAGCLHLPSEGVTSANEECRKLSSQVREMLQDLSPRWIVLHGYTAGRFTTINSGGGQQISLIDAQSGQLIDPDRGHLAYKVALEETLDMFSSNGARTIIISGSPDFNFRPEDLRTKGNTASMSEILFAPLTGEVFGQEVTRAVFLDRHGAFRDIEWSLASTSSLVQVVDPWDALCKPEMCTQVDDDGNLIFSDQDHISDFGAKRLASLVISLITG